MFAVLTFAILVSAPTVEATLIAQGRGAEAPHQPQVVVDDAGKIHLAYGQGNSVLHCLSSDLGKTFSKPVALPSGGVIALGKRRGPRIAVTKKATKLGQVTWRLNACPMDGGAVATAPDGSVSTAWRRDGEIYITSPKKTAGQRVGQGTQPWLAATAKGSYVVWLAGQSSELMLLEPGAKQAAPLAAKAADPVIAAGPQGSGPLVVAWETRETGSSAVYCQLIGQGKSK